MNKKKTYAKKPFESTGHSSDTSANLYMSMLNSRAWRDLTVNQRQLYLYCKAQYYAEKQKPNEDRMNFTMNQSKWCGLYGLYKKSNAKGFYRDMAALIEHGFVRCVECGANTRTKSIYAFSDMWQRFGTEEFRLRPCDKTIAMRNTESRKKRLPMATLLNQLPASNSEKTKTKVQLLTQINNEKVNGPNHIETEQYDFHNLIDSEQ